MTESRLYRLSAVAGVLSAAVLVVNVLRRAGVVPTNAVTHGVGPLAGSLALFAITGLYLWQRSRAGLLGLAGYAVSVLGVAGAVGIEVCVHFVFAHLPKAQVDQLTAGPSRAPFVVIAAVFSLGALLFGAALLRAPQVPRVAAGTYLVTIAAFAWRNALPEWSVTVLGLLAAAASAWLSWALWTASTPAPRPGEAAAARVA